MFELLEAQKRDINQLYIVRQKAITDIYRANNYAAQIQGILQKINALIKVYENLKHTVTEMTDKERKEYAQLLNNISTELKFLKATSQAANEQIQQLKKTTDIEAPLNNEILTLKKETDRVLKKVIHIIEG